MSAQDLTVSLLLVIQLVDMIHGASSSTSRPPRITEHPSDVTVMRNDPATLRCAFTGIPPPEVTWYRDGEVVEPRGHRLLLPDGALFFLRVTQGRGRNGGDAGTYWCAARNSAGVARSRNATLTVAYLQPDFRLLPEPTRAVLGETAMLHCQAPRGQPEPDVTWRRNGLPVAWDDELALDKERVKVMENGDLVIRHVLPSDEGKYQCVAHNMAGTRESPVVPLSVHVRPQVSIPAKEAVVVLGEDAVFECNASGDPTPSLLWRRLDAPLPAGRARATENRSGLKIERVTLADGGQYQCEVENAVGTASAVVRLTVLVPPSWNSSPASDIQVEASQNVTVNCTASGSPLPLIFWRREGLKQQDFNESRWNVLSNGTLVIRDTDKVDAGPLYCAAINEGGAILARVNLDVSLPTYSVPVFFKIGPTNQTLPIRSPALLQCETDNSTVRWTRNGTAVDVDTADPSQRFRVLPSGSLQIENLQLDDSGVYTCWAGENETLSSWTATLTVENPINPNVAFNRAPSDPLALPGPPTQPVMTNHTASSVTISWQSSSRMGASPLIGYTVELFSPDTRLPSAWNWGQTNQTDADSGWTVVARRLKANSFTVEGLKAGSSILALVRAENSHGLSLPSPVSRWIQTATNWIVHPELIQTRDLLSGSLLQLNHVVPLNATAVELHWDIVDGESYIEGLYLFHFKNSAAGDGDAAAVKIRSALITEPSLMAHTLGSLSPDTNYTFFLIPFYGSVEGRPSNSKSVKTGEDAPSGYPQNVTVRQFNESSVLVQWSAPLPQQRNGNISAYQIYVYSAETNMLLANLTLPSTSTSIAVGGLEGGTRYAFRAAAWTRMGIGPASPPRVLVVEMMNPTSTVPISDQGGMNSLLPPGAMAQETWLIVLIGGTLLVFLLTVVLVVVIKRRKMRKNGGVGRQSSSDQGFLWPTPTQPWTSSDPSKDVHPQLGPDYAEVFHSNPMSSFVAQPPAAYASTTLVRNSSASLPFRYQPGGRSVHQADPCSFSVQMRKSSQPLIPNWVELLPPPPQHPPPPLTPADQPKSQYPSFITSTLPSSMHVGAAGSGGCNPVSGGHHYPLRTSLNAQSHPTLISDHVRNSFQAHLNRHSGGPQLTPQQQHRYPGSGEVDDALYATCTYDQIEHYPLSSYR